MNSSSNWSRTPCAKEPPDFNNLLAVLARSTPQRPTLFEFFLNGPLYARLAPDAPAAPEDLRVQVQALYGFRNAGYDYATLLIPGLSFATGLARRDKSRSMNEGAVIHDAASFDAYAWPDPDAADYDRLNRLRPFLPDGMKWIYFGPGGVLENVIELVGYENLCFLSIDNPSLTDNLFEAVGSRLVRFYERGVQHDTVGAIIGNDDWGFKSQTMLPPDQMRRWVFPWHKKIVELAHAAGKPAILHSCGCLTEIFGDIVDDMRYDGKHSYEDAILPVEDAYDRVHDRIAILGGIDVDFVCRAAPRDVYDRSCRMLRRGSRGYALGTGNSVPEYVPHENYFAMIRAALDFR